MLGLFGTSSYAVFVYFIFVFFVFVFLYLCFRHVGISFLISLNNPLFKNIPHVGSFWHFVICCICVFVHLYLCISICVFARLTHESIIFDTLEQSSFQKYTTYWVYLELFHMLYLCTCVFVFVHLCMRHLVISVLISFDQKFSENVWFVWSKTSYSEDVTMRD